MLSPEPLHCVPIIGLDQMSNDWMEDPVGWIGLGLGFPASEPYIHVANTCVYDGWSILLQLYFLDGIRTDG
jgi:hypothetical protein